jgi:hypothetical protein
MAGVVASFRPKCDPSCMTEEEIVERFEQNEEAIKAYKEQIDSLKDDLEVVITLSNINFVDAARRQFEIVMPTNNWANAPEPDKTFQAKCKRFAERYEKLSQA